MEGIDYLIQNWKYEKIITDNKILEAFKKIPRENFILKEHMAEAYGDYPLPIPADQTISQPTTVAIMTQALNVKEGNKVLEIGTGSGYQAAILGYLVGKKGHVYTTEYYDELVNFARENLRKTKIKNVTVIKTDGSQGLKKYAPYHRIIVTAAAPKIPDILLEQLKNKGILVAPVGSRYSQEMLRIKKIGKKREIKRLGSFIFVRLRGKYGWD